MSANKLKASLVAAALTFATVSAHPNETDTETRRQHLKCLVDAYPGFIKFTDDTQLSVVDSTNNLLPYDSQRRYGNFNEELDNADLYSQMRQPYQLGRLSSPPAIDMDPGRLRYTPLFEEIYGASKKEVESNLVSVHWAPCNCNVRFSKVNGAAKALEQVGLEIKQAGLSDYVQKSLGTFNWRIIAGTKRLSMHSFGIAIDFELPNKLGRYWRWDKNHKTNGFPVAIISDEKLNRVVDIFEQHGFIWGGKWWHYDSIHFEYRPELTASGCAARNSESTLIR